jgi:hypothetical protein
MHHHRVMIITLPYQMLNVQSAMHLHHCDAKVIPNKSSWKADQHCIIILIASVTH